LQPLEVRDSCAANAIEVKTAQQARRGGRHGQIDFIGVEAQIADGRSIHLQRAGGFPNGALR